MPLAFLLRLTRALPEDIDTTIDIIPSFHVLAWDGTKAYVLPNTYNLVVTPK